MDIILYLFSIRFRSFFNFQTNKSRLITLILLLLMAFTNGYYFSYLNINEAFIAPNKFKGFYLAFTFFSLYAQSFVPTYTPLKEIIPPYFPVKSWKRVLVRLFNDLFSTYLFTILIFLITVQSFSFNIAIITVLFTSKLTLIALSAIILRQITQLCLERKIGNRWLFLMVIIITLITPFIVSNLFFVESIIWPNLVLFALVFILLWIIDSIATEVIPTKSHSSNIESIYISIIYRNPILKVSLLMGLVVKVFLLAIISYGHFKKNKYPPEFIIYLFTMPTLIFTYAFNNIFGILRSFWFTVNITRGIGKPIFVQIMSLMMVPLLIDFIMSFIFFVFNQKFMVDGLIAYFVSALLLTILSIYWSSSVPIYIENKWSINTRKTTSIVATIVTIMLIAFLFLATINIYFKIIYIFYIITSALLFVGINKHYKSEYRKIFDSLFKIN
jgi:hypothetical protein